LIAAILATRANKTQIAASISGHATVSGRLLGKINISSIISGQATVSGVLAPFVAPAFIPAGQSFNIQIIGGPTPSTTVYGEMIWNIRIDMIPWLAERCGGTPIFLNIAARTNLQAVAEARGFIMHNIGTL
jgi:hypothetical protein